MQTETEIDLSNELSRVMLDQDETDVTLAKKTGSSPTTIWRARMGLHSPNAGTRVLFARALRKRPDQITYLADLGLRAPTMIAG